MKAVLVPFVADGFEKSSSWLYQRDGAAIHTSRENDTWMCTKGIYTLTRSSMSLDINIIKNFGGDMVAVSTVAIVFTAFRVI